MAEAEEFNQYKEHLLTMLNSINAEIPLKESNQVLIVYKLNTVEKIRKFFKILKLNLQEGKLIMTEEEIVREIGRASCRERVFIRV